MAKSHVKIVIAFVFEIPHPISRWHFSYYEVPLEVLLDLCFSLGSDTLLCPNGWFIFFKNNLLKFTNQNFSHTLGKHTYHTHDTWRNNWITPAFASPVSFTKMSHTTECVCWKQEDPSFNYAFWVLFLVKCLSLVILLHFTYTLVISEI